jgi:ribonuclease BN (tRNA processing enzyme)
MSYTRRDFIIKTGIVAGAAAVNLPSGTSLSGFNEPEGDRLVLLGTQGGPFIRSYTQSPSASLIVYNNIPYVIDTGYGVTFKLLEAKISLPSLRHIFITHHHSDHNLELGPLLYNCWIRGLATEINVYGPVGLKNLLFHYWESNRFDIETRIADEERPDIRELVIAHEYKEGTILSNQGVEVMAMRNIHPPVTESYAFKFKLGKRTIVFSGDTAYYPALAEFAAGADYLVHEVMHGPGVDAMVKRRPNAPKLKASILSHHTLAEDVGKIATAANVGTLVLNHFVPPDDKSLTDQAWIDAVRTTFSGKIVVGKDLLQLPL